MKKNFTWFLAGLFALGILGLCVYNSKPTDKDIADEYAIKEAEHEAAWDRMFDENGNFKIGETKTIWSDPNGYIVEIHYEDFDDDYTERKIKITEVKINDSGIIYLFAYCFEREADRTFRLDKVIEFFDKNGNQIPNDKVYKKLNIE